MTDDEFNIKYNNMNTLQLCQNNVIDYAVLTKDNFIHLLTKWGNLFKAKEPFVLLYLDDKGWYDVLPFDSLESMNKFAADHTIKEQENIKTVVNNNLKRTDSQTTYNKIVKIITIIFVIMMLLIRLMNLVKH